MAIHVHLQRDAGKPLGKLLTKQAVSYQWSPKDGKSCGGCSMMVGDRSGTGIGSCTLVEGGIVASGYCTRWAPVAGARP